MVDALLEKWYNIRENKNKNMRAVSDFEEKKLVNVLGKNPEMLLHFKGELVDKGAYVENFESLYDKSFFEEFMTHKLKDVLSENKNLIKTKAGGAEVTEEMVMKALEESGSMGITVLVEKILLRMEEKVDFGQDLIENLLSLIGLRNELQSLEMEVLKDEYELFLENKILELEG